MPHPASGPDGTPAANSTVNTMAASTSVVPRFGWSISSTAATPNTAITGRKVSRESWTLVERAGQQVGGEEQDAELGELGRLDLDDPDAEPAARRRSR